ncbi:MAG TPA: cupin domain-containing protein [Stellaceae bacterium]|nr:cupin domain-containing protein [Stellaceae bacterium]
MRLAIFGTLLLMAATVSPATAQNPPTAPAAARTVVASAKLPELGTAPLYFCALAVTIPTGAMSRIAASPNGILYQLEGSTEIAADGETKTLAPGEGFFLAGGRDAALRAGGNAPSRMLHFLLMPAAALDKPVETEPAAITELYRTPAPIPELKPGAYDINLTRVTFPPRMPTNPPHHRSGAALYYIVSGTGANTVAGMTTVRGPDALIYEPSSLVHQWGNPSAQPWTFLAFNINPEGVPAVVMEAAPK